MKSFQDEYKFGSSADLGVSCEYEWSNFIYTDFIVLNGEGYKNLQIGKGLQYGLGITTKPFKNLTLRVYASYNEYNKSETNEENDYKGTTNIAGFIGYEYNQLSIGAEYNYMKIQISYTIKIKWAYQSTLQLNLNTILIYLLDMITFIQIMIGT